MFGKLGDMMGKLKEMKEKADEIKQQLDEVIVKTEAAGGDIKIEMSGNRRLKKLDISPSLQHNHKEELERQLVLAINKAIDSADKVNEEAMKKAASGLLPGI